MEAFNPSTKFESLIAACPTLSCVRDSSGFYHVRDRESHNFTRALTLNCTNYIDSGERQRQVLKISENLVVPSGHPLWAQDLQMIIYEEGVVTNTGRTVKEVLHSLKLAQVGLSLFDAALDVPGNLRRKYSDRVRDGLDTQAEFRVNDPRNQIDTFTAARNLVDAGIFHYLFA